MYTHQLRLEGTYTHPTGLGEEVVFDFNNDGSCTITCRTYTPRSGKLKIVTVRVPKAEWVRFRNFISDKEEYLWKTEGQPGKVKDSKVIKSTRSENSLTRHELRLFGSVWRCSCGSEFANEDDARMHRLNV